MSKMNPNLPGLMISVKDINESSIPQARNPSLSSPYIPYPPHPQVLLVSASRNLTYLFLPLHPTFTAIVQAVSLTYLDPCNGLLHFPSLFLDVAARELFKISTDCVTVSLQPFRAFPLPLRWPSRPRATCSCLLLCPHLSPASLLSKYLDLCTTSRPLLSWKLYDMIFFPLWMLPTHSLPTTPLPAEILSFFTLGWWAHSWEHDAPRLGLGSLLMHIFKIRGNDHGL